MLEVQGKLISLDVVEKQFVCNLEACLGACCWEGDFGAPLESAELATLEAIYEQVKPLLSLEGVQAIEEQGVYTYFEEAEDYGTPLVENGACAYMIYDQRGMAKCGIELAYEKGLTRFKKPISCHLYPIRIKEEKRTNFMALNYDEWDICSAACNLGERLQVPIYAFVKDALIRKFGEGFYEELDAAATHWNSTS